MKTYCPQNHRRPSQRGYALAVVLVFMGVSLGLLGGALSWSSSNSMMNQRNNQYFNTVAAAESATEKIVSRMSTDFQSGGEALVYANLYTYRSDVPTASESAYWGNFEFSDGSGNVGQTHIQRLSSASYVPLESQYTGLYGLAATYRVISNARDVNSEYDIPTAVNQDVQVATIPIFQFAIWYALDLEINPGPNMTINGRVHSNSDIFLEPVNQLTFQSDITSSGGIYHHKKPGDPQNRNSSYNIVYDAEHDAGVASMTLPVGANNDPASIREILAVPPSTESPTSQLGQERFYNKSDLVVLVEDTGVTVKSGLWDGFGTTLSADEAGVFLNQDVQFYDKRELKTVKSTEIDVGKFKSWSETNLSIRSTLGRDVSSVYVADQRSHSSSYMGGVRVKNGQTLPDLGLTVSSPNPMYVQGHYNAPSADLGTHNTAGTKPAALIGDALTVLSTAWNDANSTLSKSKRKAQNTTVNAAIMAGIVETTQGTYSGGVENFPRFLEKWSGKKLTYTGSMVVMFQSQYANSPWGGSGVYSPPARDWAFDVNFLDAAKLPPGTPAVKAIVRGKWQTLAHGVTSF